jgi:hypothetical protein
VGSHVSDLVLPLSACVASGTVENLRRLLARQKSGQRFLSEAFSLLPSVMAMIGISVHLQTYNYWRSWFNNTSLTSLKQVASAMAANSRTGDWVIVDRPILAFLPERAVPPELAMISRKRVISGALTEDQLLRGLKEFGPFLVVLCTSRFTGYATFLKKVDTDYRGRPRLAPADCTDERYLS